MTMAALKIIITRCLCYLFLSSTVSESLVAGLEDCRRQLLKQSANMIIMSQFGRLCILSGFGSKPSPDSKGSIA